MASILQKAKAQSKAKKPQPITNLNDQIKQEPSQVKNSSQSQVPSKQKQEDDWGIDQQEAIDLSVIKQDKKEQEEQPKQEVHQQKVENVTWGDTKEMDDQEAFKMAAAQQDSTLNEQDDPNKGKKVMKSWVPQLREEGSFATTTFEEEKEYFPEIGEEILIKKVEKPKPIHSSASRSDEAFPNGTNPPRFLNSHKGGFKELELSDQQKKLLEISEQNKKEYNNPTGEGFNKSLEGNFTGSNNRPVEGNFPGYNNRPAEGNYSGFKKQTEGNFPGYSRPAEGNYGSSYQPTEGNYGSQNKLKEGKFSSYNKSDEATTNTAGIGRSSESHSGLIRSTQANEIFEAVSSTQPPKFLSKKFAEGGNFIPIKKDEFELKQEEAQKRVEERQKEFRLNSESTSCLSESSGFEMRRANVPEKKQPEDQIGSDISRPPPKFVNAKKDKAGTNFIPLLEKGQTKVDLVEVNRLIDTKQVKEDVKVEEKEFDQSGFKKVKE